MLDILVTFNQSSLIYKAGIIPPFTRFSFFKLSPLSAPERNIILTVFITNTGQGRDHQVIYPKDPHMS